jgi:hypothetical protein
MNRIIRLVARVLIVSVSLAATAPTVANAGDGNGSVRRAWISQTSGGPAASTFHADSVARLYANFTWASTPAPGLKLQIRWEDPKGATKAVWTSRTFESDKPGTRLFAWISGVRTMQEPGIWRAVLLVDDTPVRTKAFRATATSSLRSMLHARAVAETPAPWRSKARYALHMGKRFPRYAGVHVSAAPGYESIVQEVYMIFTRAGAGWKTVSIGGSFDCSQLSAGLFADVGVRCY